MNLVTPVAQALEMAKSELKRKGEDSITDGGRKTATSDWNSLRYYEQQIIAQYAPSVGFYVDGQSYPSQPLRPNYEADKYVDCYRTLTCFRKDIKVKRNDYVKGYCLYALEIDPYYSFNIKRQGHCRLDMKFAKPLPESAT